MNPTVGKKIYVRRIPGLVRKGVYNGIAPTLGHIIITDHGDVISFLEWHDGDAVWKVVV